MQFAGEAHAVWVQELGVAHIKCSQQADSCVSSCLFALLMAAGVPSVRPVALVLTACMPECLLPTMYKVLLTLLCLINNWGLHCASPLLCRVLCTALAALSRSLPASYIRLAVFCCMLLAMPACQRELMHMSKTAVTFV